MKEIVGLPCLRDVCRKARSYSFGPFVRYETFLILSTGKGEKKKKIQRKSRKKRQKFTTLKSGKKKQRRKDAT